MCTLHGIRQRASPPMIAHTEKQRTGAPACRVVEAGDLNALAVSDSTLLTFAVCLTRFPSHRTPTRVIIGRACHLLNRCVGRSTSFLPNWGWRQQTAAWLAACWSADYSVLRASNADDWWPCKNRRSGGTRVGPDGARATAVRPCVPAGPRHFTVEIAVCARASRPQLGMPHYKL